MICNDPHIIKRIITPWAPRTRHKSGLSFGQGPAGYDIRTNNPITVQPSRSSLVVTFESFKIPTHLCGILHDKSSWARKGLAVQNTVLEPGWRGYLTIELSNHSDMAIEIESLTPIGQIIFHQITNPSQYSGHYQDQKQMAIPSILDKG